MKIARIFAVAGALLPLFASVVLCRPAAAQLTGCPLNSSTGQISHVVYIQFDNVHFERENPNVPSDLEQMPHLLNFLEQNGTLFANTHTPLISHTADDILTSLTGVYGDRHGQAVANSFVIWNQPSNPYWDSFPSSFTYWTNPVSLYSNSDTAFSMITAAGQNAPAPWVPFTRAGCNVGAVSIANMEMENVTSDLANLYGTSENSDPNKVADFEGIAIHCAQGSSVCAGAHGKADILPQEPGGYTGFNGLFGHKYVVPAITSPSSTTLTDLTGSPITGFPGFGGISPAQTLAYVAQMLENGVPVVFSYISDAHDCHASTAAACDGVAAYRAFGPGEAPYVAQLAAYDNQFDLFFQRLAADGITPSNTLFIVGSDEQDHFVGGDPSPANCDGVTTPCTYTYPTTTATHTAGTSSIGEIDADLQALYAAQFPSLVPNVAAASNIFDFHYDMAPALYFQGYGPNGGNTAGPGYLRQFERAAAQLTAVNPITGNTDMLSRYLADQTELKALHMVTGDPFRTPNFVMFADPDYYFEGYTSSSCRSTRTAPGCVVQQEPGYAWNHGGVAPEINTTWVGFAGPGVESNGVDGTTWADETDIRPTVLLLTGLKDDNAGDGRALVEGLDNNVLPTSLRGAGNSPFMRLAQAYKQINAPVGDFGLTSLNVSTTALSSNDANDATYTRLEAALANLTSQRDVLAAKMVALLQAAEFNGQRLNASQVDPLVQQAQQLLQQLHNLN